MDQQMTSQVYRIFQEFKEVDQSSYSPSKLNNNTFKVNEEQLQGVLTTSLIDKIKIESLEKQLSEKDHLLKLNQERMIQLEQEISAQNLKYKDLSDQIQNILQENNSLKEQMILGNKIPSHVTSEIENLKNNIKQYEQQVQKVIQSEQTVRQQLENEIITKQNLNCLIEELEYQLSKYQQQQQVQSPCNSDASKDDMITGLSFEKNSLQDTNKKLLRELKDIKETQIRTQAEYEKEMSKLKDEKTKQEKELKQIDDKHKKKHSFIQAENSYVLGQLSVMKIEIDEKNVQIEKLQAQIQQLEQGSAFNNNTQLFENKEIQHLQMNYQALIENEHNRYNETCQTYELEISHYKQQIQSLIDNGTGTTDERITQLKNDIANLEKNNEKNLIQIYLLTTKNEELLTELDKIRLQQHTPEVLQQIPIV